MEETTKEIGAFEAKTRLAELLRETEQGRSFIILRRGKAVARLVPVDSEAPVPDWDEIADAFLKIRRGIRGKFNIRKLIEEGRRHR